MAEALSLWPRCGTRPRKPPGKALLQFSTVCGLATASGVQAGAAWHVLPQHPCAAQQRKCFLLGEKAFGLTKNCGRGER